MSCPWILGVENCSMRYSRHLFECTMTNHNIDAKDMRAQALGTRAQDKGARAQDMPCPCILGVENCSMTYSRHLFECTMTNHNIDA